jgi:hypothetical protein
MSANSPDILDLPSRQLIHPAKPPLRRGTLSNFSPPHKRFSLTVEQASCLSYFLVRVGGRKFLQ